MNFAQQLFSRGLANDQQIARNPGGRPISPESKRQRTLSYLDGVEKATRRQIEKALGLEDGELQCVMYELSQEEQIEEVGKVGREKLWSIPKGES